MMELTPVIITNILEVRSHLSCHWGSKSWSWQFTKQYLYGLCQIRSLDGRMNETKLKLSSVYAIKRSIAHSTSLFFFEAYVYRIHFFRLEKSNLVDYRCLYLDYPFFMMIQSIPLTSAQFHQRSTYSFYTRSSTKRKNSVKLSVSFYAFGTYERKSCT